MGRRELRVGNKRVMFTPVGPRLFRGRGTRGFVENPALWSGEPADAARLFVGLNVGDTPTWSIKDVMEIVGAERMAQTGDPSASFVGQRGIFKHGAGHVVEEDSVQVVVLNLDESVSRDRFEQQMVRLATRLADVLQQELVIVEMQHGGRADKTIGVGP